MRWLLYCKRCLIKECLFIIRVMFVTSEPQEIQLTPYPLDSIFRKANQPGLCVTYSSSSLYLSCDPVFMLKQTYRMWRTLQTVCMHLCRRFLCARSLWSHQSKLKSLPWTSLSVRDLRMPLLMPADVALKACISKLKLIRRTENSKRNGKKDIHSSSQNPAPNLCAWYAET